MYTAGLALAISSFAGECHPQINSNEQNFVVGYGSLMNDSSRMRTNPKAKDVYPVEVKNFERVWGLRAGGSYRTTALLVVPKQGAHFNAVYYPVNSDGMKSADSREVHYPEYFIINIKKYAKKLYLYILSPIL